MNLVCDCMMDIEQLDPFGFPWLPSIGSLGKDEAYYILILNISPQHFTDRYHVRGGIRELTD